MKTFKTFILILIACSVNVHAQNITPNQQVTIDSLLKLINNPKSHDTTKINARSQFGELNMIYRLSFWDSISNDCDAIIKQKPTQAVKLSILKMQAAAINNLGVISSHQGTQEATIKYFEKGLEINQQIDNKKGVAELLENIGAIYKDQGRIVDALGFFNKSLVISESINDKKRIASTYNRIAQINAHQGDTKTALKNFDKSIALHTEIDNQEGIAGCMANIATIYKDYGDPNFNNLNENRLNQGNKKALEYYLKSLEIYERLGKKHSIATVLSNIGSIYNAHGDPTCTLPKEECLKKGKEIALIYSHQSLKLREELGDNKGIASSLINLAYLNYNIRKLNEAEKYGLQGLKMSQNIGLPENVRNAAFLLSKVYEAKNGESQSLEMYKLHVLMRDSLNNQTTEKAALIQETQFEYEKQKVLDDAKNDKLLAIEQQEKEKQKIIAYATGFGLLLVVVFLFFVFNRLRITKKQKNIIEEQKDVVEHAHQELSEKNKEITDSIQYAKRIQNAILPPDKLVKEYLHESFILYRPKDIVAGDFYWMEHRNGKVLFAAADCTGHGVPGAMVSVVCNNALNRSVREHNIITPGEILNKTREIVVTEFEKSDDEVKDGMDIALCSIEGNNLEYAGANNPLWIIRNNELIEIKANKQPIGKFDNPEPYTTHQVALQKGDTIYIFSDGYVDQFGGQKGKKLKTPAFRELLLSIQDKSMAEQKQIIDSKFINWKGDIDQVDDICVIGVRV